MYKKYIYSFKPVRISDAYNSDIWVTAMQMALKYNCISQILTHYFLSEKEIFTYSL